MGKPWARYEVGYINHDKFRAIPANAICLWLEGKNYADAKSTDGLLPAYEVKHWRFYSKTNVTILTTSCGLKPGTDAPYAALWEAHPVGFKMHDYLDHNDCRDVVMARKAQAEVEKQKDRDRKAVARAARWSGGLPAGSPVQNSGSPGGSPAGSPEPVRSKSPDTGAESASIQKAEVRREKEPDSLADASGDWPDGWLDDLSQLYRRIYRTVRSGAEFHFDWRRDETPMVRVMHRYGDHPTHTRFAKMLEIFLRMRERTILNTPGTPAQFLLAAPECDRRLREDGQ